ncbi:FAD-dependent oxidoreductase [Actinokineospora enzanensis]|uniref:FAD-dependent oxidoreductase n=1 Tax=Actinokineospora enzanensis TaxID=155975 RepID=UPI0003667DDC|nr:FAD-dependent oxidoreductase [Actinokineospora enzanensis]
MPEAAVLVAGAGPVGLVVAHELARRGVRVRVVDAAPGPATTSRAMATHARTLELFDQIGLAERLLPLGRKVEHFSVHQRGRRLVRFDTNYDALPTRFPFSLMVDQVLTERVLREGVAGQGVDIEWSVAVAGLEQDADGVTVRLRHGHGGLETVRVPWLVGADGGRSVVRKSLGLRLSGDSTQTWLNADVVVDVDLPPNSNHLVHTGAGALLLVPFPEPGKWRVIDTVDHEGDAETVRARIEAKLTGALRKPVSVSAPTWVSVFTVQQRMIERMRVGRCFVAGDAAHVHSPASGQGMNTGLQDGINLAWKLADVVRGHATETLLDTYGAERVPIGATLLRSTRTATALVALRDTLAPVLLPLGLGVVSRVRPLKRKIEGKIVRGFCGLGLNYRDSPLSTVATGSGWQPGDRVGCTEKDVAESPGWRALLAQLRDPRWTLLHFAGPSVVPLSVPDTAVALRTVLGASSTGDHPAPLPDPDGRLHRAFGGTPGSYALIRPDGYLAARGPADTLPATLRRVGLPADPVRPGVHSDAG